MSSRARRQTAKVINYAKEQEFSDDDVFEDEAEKEEEVKPVRRRGRPRKNEVDEPVDETDYGPTNLVFTEKGYDANLPPIRERFPFLPEYEPDGSPRVELIVGRRPIQKKQKGEEEEPQEDADDGKKGRKRGKKQDKKTEATSDVTEYEYLIKYKGKSYLHLDWKTAGDLESMNKSAKTLYRRFLKKLSAGMEDDLEDTEFDPSFIQPQKIVDEDEHEVTVELSDKELIEWEKEREKEIDDDSDEDDEMKIEGLSKDKKKKEGEEKKEEEEDAVMTEDKEEGK